MEEPQYPDRFSRFLHWLPRPLGSLVVGIAFGAVMFPGALLIAAGDLRVAGVASGALAVFFGVGMHWFRVEYGDLKHPGRRTGRRQTWGDAE